MSLWNKIKHGFEHGAPVAFERAAAWLKSGAELAEVGAERLSARIIYASRLSKLRSEQREIKKGIEAKFATLGETVYDLWREGKQTEFAQSTREYVAALRSSEDQLAGKSHEIEELVEQFHVEPIDRRSLNELKSDLEAGGGTVEQTTIEEGSLLIGKKLKEIHFPDEILIGTILREGEVLIPDGDTAFQIGDRVALLGKRDDVEKTIKQFQSSSPV